MQELMKNNTDLAQKLWVGVMKHMTSKGKLTKYLADKNPHQ